MEDPFVVPANERGQLRVFALAMTEAEVDDLRAPQLPPASVNAAAIAKLLGTSFIDPQHVDLFHTDTIAALGLSAYLIEGCTIPDTQIMANKPQLDSYRGPVLIVRSPAFGAKTATLQPIAKVTLLGSFTEEVPSIRFEPLPDASAKGILTPNTKPPKSDARIGGMVATVVLILMFIFVGVFVWMGS